MKAYSLATNVAPSGYGERVLVQNQFTLHLATFVIFGDHSIHVGDILVVVSDAGQRNRCFELTLLPVWKNAIKYSAHYYTSRKGTIGSAVSSKWALAYNSLIKPRSPSPKRQFFMSVSGILQS